MAFRCVVVTPEQQALDESITQAILPAHDGLMGIQTHRAPLLVKLGVGPLRVDFASGSPRTFFIDGGIAQMKGDNLTILTTEATPAADIDAQAARAEYAEAEARRGTDPKTVAEREHGMARGRAKQKIAGTQQ